MYVASIMPCTAKKYELERTHEMYASGYIDVDIALTTRELARMIKQSGIDFLNLPDGEADSILGDYTGAGMLFGVTGGVMEAALRTAYFLITGHNLEKLEFEPVRGLQGVKEARDRHQRLADPRGRGPRPGQRRDRAGGGARRAPRRRRAALSTSSRSWPVPAAASAAAASPTA